MNRSLVNIIPAPRHNAWYFCDTDGSVSAEPLVAFEVYDDGDGFFTYVPTIITDGDVEDAADCANFIGVLPDGQTFSMADGIRIVNAREDKRGRS